eukprot:scaffold18555_cov60-Phaeocystis_antarctica.AAC.2
MHEDLGEWVGAVLSLRLDAKTSIGIVAQCRNWTADAQLKSTLVKDTTKLTSEGATMRLCGNDLQHLRLELYDVPDSVLSTRLAKITGQGTAAPLKQSCLV